MSCLKKFIELVMVFFIEVIVRRSIDAIECIEGWSMNVRCVILPVAIGNDFKYLYVRVWCALWGPVSIVISGRAHF